MTEIEDSYTPEELIGCLRLANVPKSRLHAEKLSDIPVNGVQFTAEIAFATDPQIIRFKIGYRLRLLSGPLKAEPTDVESAESQPTDVGILEATVVIVYQIVDPPRPGWEKSAQIAGGLAIMSAHPYLRDTIASSAASIDFPPITLGLLRAGAMTPESVAVAQRVYQFADNEK